MLKGMVGTVMKGTIVIGVLGFVLLSTGAAAQTAVEREHILRDFDRSLVEYVRQRPVPGTVPGMVLAATPAPAVFTPPVAMVFRQLIARALTIPSRVAISGTTTTHRAVVLQPFPTNELTPFPEVLIDTLPALPHPLEYRLLDNDLVVRDAEADVIIAVLRQALGTITTRF